MKGIARRRGRGILAVSAAAGLALQTGCDTAPTAPVEDGIPTVMAVLATARAQASSGDGSERWEGACPGGGRTVIEGDMSVTKEEGLWVHRWNQELRQEACVLLVGQRQVRTDGAMHLVGESRSSPPVGQVARPVWQRATQSGWLTTVYDRRSSTCTYDLSIDLDPGTNVYRVHGQACGRTVDDRIPVRP